MIKSLHVLPHQVKLLGEMQPYCFSFKFTTVRPFTQVIKHHLKRYFQLKCINFWIYIEKNMTDRNSFQIIMLKSTDGWFVSGGSHYIERGGPGHGRFNPSLGIPKWDETTKTKSTI